jgi:hypothetical protein
MKNKILVFFVIISFIGLSTFVSAENNTSEETNELYQENIVIDYFYWGFIRGRYDTEEYDKEGRLVLKNEDYDDTIKIKGFYFGYYGDLPEFGFGTEKTWKVRISKFYGFHDNGMIRN